MRKGQYAIIEHTILLGVGITLTLGLLLMFETVGEDVSDTTTDIQMRLASEYMAVHAIELVESGAEGRVTASMPAAGGGQDYAITLSDDGVSAVTSGSRHVSPLYGLPSRISAEGSVVSQDTDATVTYRNGTLEVAPE